jgi:translocation and assembly module TamA
VRQLLSFTEKTAPSKRTPIKTVGSCRYFFLLFWFAALGPVLFTPQGAWAFPSTSYSVTITGIEDPALLKDLKDVSDSLSLKDRPPASMGLLRTRAERDRERFVKLLHGHGYFGAQVDVSLKDQATPPELVFRIEPGSVYPVGSTDIRITGEKEIEPRLIPSPEKIGLVPGKPFSASALMDGERALVRTFEKQGFPFARLHDRKIIVDHRDRTVALEFFLDPGPQATFGKTGIRGLETVEETAIRRLIPWKEGALYHVEQVEALQLSLFRLGLFSSARVLKGAELDERGRLPVDISVTERKHRSIGAGISYKTDEGPGATALWEHRNLFREGERLTLSGTASDFTVSAESTFFKPFFLRRDQSLRLFLRVAEDQPDPYTSRNISTSASVARQLTDQLLVRAGLGYKASRVDQLGVRESFTYLFLPLDLEWDRSDDLLDPAAGGRLGLYLAPFYDPFGSDPEFLKSRIRYRHYVKPFASRPLVLAAGLSLGAITGAGRDEIPADERFYAGGGGSIRGYAYQSVAPFRQGEPVGGRSLLELAFEARLKFTERLGLVAFLDGGNAYEKRVPDLDETLFWGAGLGFRYFTPVGPLRLDVAFPLNRRPGIDDRVQVYVSLGQAF